MWKHAQNRIIIYIYCRAPPASQPDSCSIYCESCYWWLRSISAYWRAGALGQLVLMSCHHFVGFYYYVFLRSAIVLFFWGSLYLGSCIAYYFLWSLLFMIFCFVLFQFTSTWSLANPLTWLSSTTYVLRSFVSNVLSLTLTLAPMASVPYLLSFARISM